MKQLAQVRLTIPGVAATAAALLTPCKSTPDALICERDGSQSAVAFEVGQSFPF